MFSASAFVQGALIAAIYLVTSAPGVLACGGSLVRYAAGFPVVFALAWLAQIAAGNSLVSYWGVEYVIFALIFGVTALSLTVGAVTAGFLG